MFETLPERFPAQKEFLCYRCDRDHPKGEVVSRDCVIDRIRRDEALIDEFIRGAIPGLSAAVRKVVNLDGDEDAPTDEEE